jgi:hypothetical protein
MDLGRTLKLAPTARDDVCIEILGLLSIATFTTEPTASTSTSSADVRSSNVTSLASSRACLHR